MKKQHKETIKIILRDYLDDMVDDINYKSFRISYSERQMENRFYFHKKNKDGFDYHISPQRKELLLTTKNGFRIKQKEFNIIFDIIKNKYQKEFPLVDNSNLKEVIKQFPNSNIVQRKPVYHNNLDGVLESGNYYPLINNKYLINELGYRTLYNHFSYKIVHQSKLNTKLNDVDSNKDLIKLKQKYPHHIIIKSLVNKEITNSEMDIIEDAYYPVNTIDSETRHAFFELEDGTKTSLNPMYYDKISEGISKDVDLTDFKILTNKEALDLLQNNKSITYVGRNINSSNYYYYKKDSDNVYMINIFPDNEEMNVCYPIPFEIFKKNYFNLQNEYNWIEYDEDRLPNIKIDEIKTGCACAIESH